MLEIEFLGTGTSHGIPVAACPCPVCHSPQKENKRYRSSISIKAGESRLIIDLTPEFRLQVLRAEIQCIDAVLITHAHADHLHGIDDLRPYSWKQKIPIYGQASVCQEIEDRFPYIFHPPAQGGGTPQISLIALERKHSCTLGSMQVTSIPLYHGNLEIFGYRIGDFAYLTDCSRIEEDSFSLLEDLKVLVIGALRPTPHDTHFSIPEALQIIKKISPQRAYLTHLCHDVEHFKLKDQLPEGVEPAWDGLKITIP